MEYYYAASLKNGANSITCAVLALLCGVTTASEGATPDTIEVTPSRVRARPGSRVAFTVRGVESPPRAVLLMPGGGTRPLTLDAVDGRAHRVHATLPADGAAGLYLIHVWIGEAERPDAVGKAAVLAGPIVMDFCPPISIARIRSRISRPIWTISNPSAATRSWPMR